MTDSKFSLDDLEGRSYRDLQQLAKSLGLPSNVKKMYLIQLIHAKKFKSKEEVDMIVQRVKSERSQLSKIRKNTTRKKKRVQGHEISSTSISSSPPINNTLSRPGHVVIQCNQNTHEAIMNYAQPSLLRANYSKKTYPPLKPVDSSDRVLRSFKIKTEKTQSQAKVNASILKVIKTQNTMSKRPAISQRNASVFRNARINFDNLDSDYHKVNVSTKSVATQHSFAQKPPLNIKINNEPRTQLITVPNKMNTVSTLPVKRQPIVSGIYPLVTKEPTPKVNYDYIQRIGFRRSDGKISKINALVQKRDNPNNDKDFKNISVTVQDLINSNIDSQNINTEFNAQENTSDLQYPNTTNLEYNPNIGREFNFFDVRNETYKENEYQSSVYYHKKIRAEQVRTQRRMSVQRDVRIIDEESLPRINDVFSKFNTVTNNDVTKPIYVQVSEESERVPNYPLFVSKASSTNMLESIYNFKSQFLMSQPLLQIATMAFTKSVYSTPVITSAMVQTSTATNNNQYVSQSERDSQYSAEAEMPQLSDLLAITEQELNGGQCYANDSLEDYSNSTSSLDRSGDKQASIPEMVEDALEIISQDGDYMERIGMDVRMQCILCSWAGPRIILEYHIRKDHPDQIHKQDKCEWNITYTLGSLVQQQLWLSQIIDYGSALYALSAKYEDPDYFLVTLTMLSTESECKNGTITVYDKVTGQPYSWSGNVEILPPSLPYYSDKVCLKLEISALNLIPNSANLKLINRELVIKSPSKVVVGHPELNDIQIIIFVRIFN